VSCGIAGINKIDKGEIFAIINIFLFLFCVEIISLILSPYMISSGYYVFGEEHVDNPLNAFYYMLLIVVFTIFILLTFKKGLKYVIQFTLLLIIFVTFYYIFSSFSSLILSLSISLFLTLLLYYHPEWYVIDFTAVILGAGVGAILGVSLSPLPILILLIILTVYDYISVYRTKHMISLAESIVEIRVPVIFISPKKRDFSLDRIRKNGKREAYYIGLGDVILPSTLIVSASVYKCGGMLYILCPPVFLSILGSFIGLFILLMLVRMGGAHAGLPFLISGTLIGYVVGCVISGISII
jgi:presenilin-like A22 family membrane protease